MARYDIGWAKTTGAAAAFIAQLRAGSARDVRVFELGIFATTAVAGEVALVRATGVGSGATSTAVGAALDNASAAGITVVDIAATGAPTYGTNYMRRIQLPAVIGAGVVWSFPLGINIPVSSGLILAQLSALAVGYDGYFDYDE